MFELVTHGRHRFHFRFGIFHDDTQDSMLVGDAHPEHQAGANAVPASAAHDVDQAVRGLNRMYQLTERRRSGSSYLNQSRQFRVFSADARRLL